MITGRQSNVILVVDDNVTNIKVVVDYLQKCDYETIVARNGEMGLKRARYSQPDLILLDVMMPGMDGFETCRRLKADEATKDIPVIFMTALTNVEDKVRGFAIGGVDYITKPFQVEEVLSRVETHLALRNLSRSLEEKVAELDAFAHTVAHDLKTPLVSIAGYAELLTSYGPTIPAEQRQEYLEVIVRTARKMGNIVDELLLLASVHKTDVLSEPLDMSRTVDEARQRLDLMIEEYQAEIVVPDSWPTALGYSPWVEEVWVNYLSNALKHGGRPPRVELGSDTQPDGMVRFWVRDNGPGLTVEEQARLFTPFTRLNQVQTEGQGLGLSIVRCIMEKLAGQVGVESAVGRGSVFSFTLPAGPTRTS